jgi:hypothetical protein
LVFKNQAKTAKAVVDIRIFHGMDIRNRNRIVTPANPFEEDATDTPIKIEAFLLDFEKNLPIIDLGKRCG